MPLPLLFACVAAHAVPPIATPPIVELGIADIRAAMLEDGATCAAIVQRHLDRIHASDHRLHSVIALNPAALPAARAIDALPRAARQALPLLCTPLLVKDNIDVRGMATTGGSRALLDNRASDDAPAVARLRKAGAIVLAKTNLSEFAFNYKGASATGGRTRNPYDVRNSAGGSSSGNAAALAASFGVIGLGTDTSGSLRVPAAVTGLVALRPTHGTIDNRGVIPLAPTQDVVGPMCRSADDCLRVMQVLAPATPVVAVRLDTVRVGIVRSLFPFDSRSAPFMAVVDTLMARMRQAGVQVEDVVLQDDQVIAGNRPPDGEDARFASRSAFDFPAEFDAYAATRTMHVRSYANLVATVRKLNARGLEGDRVLADLVTFGANHAHRTGDAHARVNGPTRDAYVRTRLDAAFASGAYDYLLYPSVQGFNGSATNGPDTGGTHRLSAYSGYPAIAFPAGWARPDAWSHIEPVGVELLGQRNADMALLQFVQLLQLNRRVIPNLTAGD